MEALGRPTPDDGGGPGPRADIAEMVRSVESLRRDQPGIVPAAFWDFDGTLFEGDCVDGLRRSDGAGYAGLVERAILGGCCPAYRGAAGVDQCERDYREHMTRGGRPAAYAFQSQIFAGAGEADLRNWARAVFAEDLSRWFYAEALAWWQALEAAGVWCWVVSASPDFFVKGAAAHLGVPEDRCTGMRLHVSSNGILLPRLDGPVMVAEGKIHRMHEILAGMGRGDSGRLVVPVAAFGNDPVSDGPMIEAVRLTPLPAGEAVGVYVNVPDTSCITSASLRVRFSPRQAPARSATP